MYWRKIGRGWELFSSFNDGCYVIDENKYSNEVDDSQRDNLTIWVNL